MTKSEKKIISRIETEFLPVSPQEWKQLGEEMETPTNSANQELDSYQAKVNHAYEVLEYTVTHLSKSGEILFLTAFGAEGCVLFKILADLRDAGKIYNPNNLSVANLDTGYQFKETLELKASLEQRYGFPVKMVTALLTVLEQDEKYGKDLFNRDPDQCCYMRKLVPLANLLEGKYAWITSIRRDQTEHRASALAFEYDSKFKLGKINPLIHWTKSDVWRFIHEHTIPYNVLLDQGYDSIGCEPCTAQGADRKGRWAGKDKIECGLHIQDSEMKQGGEFTI